MSTPKKIRLILIGPPVIAILILSGCLNNKDKTQSQKENIEITKNQK